MKRWQVIYFKNLPRFFVISCFKCVISVIVFVEYILFFFCRDNLKILLKDLNNQKKILKDNGIVVDDKHYQIEFVGRC